MKREFLSLPEMMKANARARPDSQALVCGSRSLSWAQWDRQLNRVANALSGMGLVPNDSIAILGTNCIETFSLFFGAIRARICAVPLSAMAAPEALKRMIEDCDAKALFVSRSAYSLVESFEHQLSQLWPGGRVGIDFEKDDWQLFDDFITRASAVDSGHFIEPDDNFNIIYSSGTTGKPKGILHSHAMRCALVAGTERWDFGPHTINLVSTPLYSNTTMAALLPTLRAGGTNLIMGKFDVQRFLHLSESQKVTHAMLVPIQVQRLMEHPEFSNYNLSSYRLKLCTSAPLHPDMKRQVITRWPGRFIEIYGLTEGGAVCILEATKYPNKLHTVGRPSRTSDIRIIDDQDGELDKGSIGEVVGRQQIMMKGYYKKPQATQEIIWRDRTGKTFLRTGDIGRFDEDGFLQILDRKKDVIISGGFNVYAIDLESLLLRHDAVEETVVIGIPSEKWGETPLALVVVKEGRTLTSDELLQWANHQLGKNQRLSAIEFRTRLPRNAIGKVLKQELKAPYWKRN